MKRSLKFEVDFPHAPEKVWLALTDSAALAQWLMPNNFEAKLGHRFLFTSKPQPGWDGKTYCEVIELDPPRRLAYSWKSGSIDTVVRWTLEAAGEGTHLVLEHTGFRGVKALMVSALLGRGWKGIVTRNLPGVLDRMDALGKLPEGGISPACRER